MAMLRYVALTLCACGGVQHVDRAPVVERPPMLAPLAPPIALTIPTPATVYNEPAPAITATPASDAMFAALTATVSGRGSPERDARLDVVATELADLHARGGELDAAVVDFALRAHGVVETAARVVVGNDPAVIAPQLADSLAFGNVHVGIGGDVVIVVHTALATLARTVPRYVEPRGTILLAATLDPAFHAPHVTITHDDRTIEHPAVAKLDPWSFQAPFHCGDHTGTQWVLIEACDAQNVLTRLALFPIECGSPPQTTYLVEPRANTAATDGETRLSAIIDRMRVTAGSEPLRGDSRVDGVARAMAESMRRSGRIDHAVDGSLTSRLLAANLMPPYAYEATLHAPDLATAAEILMNDRSYRTLLERGDVTHLGVGIAHDLHGELYIAIELVFIVPPIDVARLRADIVARMQARLPRDQRIPASKVLERLALKYVTGRALGWSEPTMMTVIQKDPELAFGPFGSMRRAMTLLLRDDVASVDLGPDPQPDGVGVAVVQSPRNGALVGRTWVIILYARHR